MPDNIIIDFQVNDEGLQPVEDRLQSLGKIDAGAAVIFKKTNAELAKRGALLQNIAYGSQQVVLSVNKEQATYNKLVVSLKTLSGQSKKTVADLLKLTPTEVSEGFVQAATNVDDFITVMQGASTETEKFDNASVSLKKELKNLTAQIAALKLSGDDAGNSFNALVKRAGSIKDAIGDAGQEIKNFSSDTRTVDNVIGSVTALAGGFTAAQGAIALFGDENKDLQETLVKVSAAMAVLQGVQQIQNALQKEGALSLLALNIQEKVTVIQTQLLAAAQSESAIASTSATIALRLFNAALNANPIGLFVTALVAVVGAFAFFINRAHDAAVAQGELNNAIYNGSTGLDAYAAGSKRALDKITSDLEKAGARQSELLKAQGKESAELINTRQKEIENLNKVIQETENSTNADTIELRGKALEEVAKLEQAQADSIIELHKKQNEFDKQLINENLQDRIDAQKKLLAQSAEGSKQQLDAQLALIKAQAALDTNDAGQDAARRAQIAAQAAKDQFEAQVQFQRRLADLRKEDLQLQLQAAQTADATLEEQHGLRLKLITAEADAEVLDTKKSAAEKAEIRRKEFADRLAEDKNFNEESRKLVLQAEIDRNQAILAQRNVSNDDALRATIESITLQAQIEIDATKNNSEKVKLIIAQRDQQIRAATLASIKKGLEDELALRSATNGPELRAIATQQAALDESFDKRRISLTGYYNYSVELIKAQSKIELDNNQLKIDALNKELKEKVISQEDYNIEYAQLSDDRVAINEEEEAKIRAASKKTAEQKKKDAEETIDFAIQTAGAVGNIILDILQNNIDAQTQKLDAQKKQIQDLQDAGKISDKEASARLKQLAKEEAKLKHDQAVKDKEAAIFNAIINTAAAVVKAYSTVGPIAGPVLAAIAAAIGAAQIAVIASRPIPQFFRGKTPGLYEGFGQVAEHGPEAIERADGTMHVQKDRGLVWLGKNDQVFTANETKAMMNSPVMRSQAVNIQPTTKQKLDIDYEKIGKAVAKHAQTNVFVDGVHAQQLEQDATINYLTTRRKYSK